MPDAFRDSVVVITGAGGGIGIELCDAFSNQGARVVAMDLDITAFAARTAEAYVVDITDAGAVQKVLEPLKHIDVLIHAAGITSLGPFADTPLDAIDRVLDVNLRGAIHVTKFALPGLRAAKGRIGVMSSVSGFSPLLYRTAYSASKHALHGFFESLRSELIDDGVSVTMICPSFVATGIEERAAHRSGSPAGAWTTTGEVTDPAHLAAITVGALSRRKRLVLPSRTARLAWAISRVAPARYEALMRRQIGR